MFVSTCALLRNNKYTFHPPDYRIKEWAQVFSSLWVLGRVREELTRESRDSKSMSVLHTPLVSDRAYITLLSCIILLGVCQTWPLPRILIFYVHSDRHVEVLFYLSLLLLFLWRRRWGKWLQLIGTFCRRPIPDHLPRG